MKNKKILFIIIGAGVVLFGGILLTWYFGWGNKKAGTDIQPIDSTSVAKKIEIQENQEPKIELNIANDRSGGSLTISAIDNMFESLEYELIYLAEHEGQEIERGVAGGPFQISESRKIREDFLFGTESCTTGVCKRKIDENVSGGTLIIRLKTADNQRWTKEMEFTIEKVSTGGYEVVWVE